MKQILMTLAFMLAFCTLALAEKKTTIYADSTNGVKTKVAVTKTANSGSSQGIEYTDTPDTGVTVESDMEDADTIDVDSYDDSQVITRNIDLLGTDFFKEMGNAAGAGIAISLFVLLLVFGFPIFIVFIAFYFRYRSRRERYRLVEKAIAAGQPIPEGILKESFNTDTRSKGIKNICLGIGLFIFLWALLDSFAMGCIGLLVMFTGIGQYLVSYKRNPTDEHK